ncbi:MAG TPA: hypothetical protein VFN35_05335, partial [Ktedonobacteraceae bacterium]|nr:hypothetical protein [Ktedonobacteraceae bacterium]
MDDIETKTPTGAPPVAEEGPTLSEQPGKRRKRRLHLGRWLVRSLLVLCFLAGFYFSVFPSGRALTRSLLILPGLLSASQPSWQAPVTEPVKHTEKTIASNAGTVYIDVYEPNESVPPVPGAREGIVVIPGVGDERHEPQLINFYETLAHAGIVVMGMTTPTLMSYQLDAGDQEAVVAAFRELQHWPGVGPERLGMLAFSGGGPLICFAAADPRIRDDVSFVTLFGSYYDTTSLLTDIGRRSLNVDGASQAWKPVNVPLQVLSNTMARYLPGNDGTVIANSFAHSSDGTLTPAQVARLAPESAAAYHLLAGDQPDRVEANIAALSPAIKAQLASLSATRVVDQLHAPVYLLHDRSDPYVPFTETREFAAALARIHHPYDLAEFGIFQHVEVRLDLGLKQILGDGTTLLR